MKKITVVGILLGLCLGLAGCSKEGETEHKVAPNAAPNERGVSPRNDA